MGNSSRNIYWNGSCKKIYALIIKEIKTCINYIIFGIMFLCYMSAYLCILPMNWLDSWEKSYELIEKLQKLFTKYIKK